MKRAAATGKVGDVVHFSRFFDELACKWHHNIWAVIVSEPEISSVSTFGALIVTGACAGAAHTAASDYDTGHIVKPEDVPDYVWSRVVFYKLVGAEDAD